MTAPQDMERLCRAINWHTDDDPRDFVRAVLTELLNPRGIPTSADEVLWAGSVGIQEYCDGKHETVNEATEAVLRYAIQHILDQDSYAGKAEAD